MSNTLTSQGLKVHHAKGSSDHLVVGNERSGARVGGFQWFLKLTQWCSRVNLLNLTAQPLGTTEEKENLVKAYERILQD